MIIESPIKLVKLPDGSEMQICQICGYGTNQNIHKHMNRKHLYEDIVYRCDYCDMSFDNEKDAKDHEPVCR